MEPTQDQSSSQPNNQIPAAPEWQITKIAPSTVETETHQPSMIDAPVPEISLRVPEGGPRRKLLALIVICAVTVGLLAGFRLVREQSLRQTFGDGLQGILTVKPLTTDPSFYIGNNPKRSAPSKPTPVAAVPEKSTLPSNGVSAQAYLVGNAATGQIYTERNGTTPLPIASMSKLMTAMIATNTIKPTATIEITPEEGSVYPDLSHIAAGESFTEKEMLYPLLLDSSNIAAEALASSSNRVKFLDLMNGYAWEIGLPTTYFADPSGLSPLNQASAEGFFDLARYVYKSRPDLLAITRIPSISVATTSSHAAHDFISIHPFVNDPRFIGGKTGHTDEAGDTMLTILNIDGQPIAFIVLGSTNRARDTSLLADQISKTLARQ